MLIPALLDNGGGDVCGALPFRDLSGRMKGCGAIKCAPLCDSGYSPRAKNVIKTSGCPRNFGFTAYDRRS